MSPLRDELQQITQPPPRPQKRKPSVHDLGVDGLFEQYKAVKTEIKQRIDTKERELNEIVIPDWTEEERTELITLATKRDEYQELMNQEQRKILEINSNIELRRKSALEKREKVAKELADLKAKFNM
jgi:hypothetical protein